MFPPKWWETEYLQCYLIFNFPACAIYRITSWQLFYGMQCSQGFPIFFILSPPSLWSHPPRNEFPLFKKHKKKRCSYFLLQLCPTFPAFLQSVLNDSLSCSDSHPVTYMCTHVNKLTHFWIKRSEMLKCLWFLEFQRRSEEIPEQIFHYNPQREGEDSLIDIYFPTDEYYNRWILFLHLYISINNVTLTQPWITSEPLFPVATSLGIVTKPARWSFLTGSLKEQTVSWMK